jgi:uncharacterized protein YjbI with pentapeptide repeats
MPDATTQTWGDWLVQQIERLGDTPQTLRRHKANLHQYLHQNEIRVALGGLGAAMEEIVKDVLGTEGWPAAKSLIEDIETLGGQGRDATSRRGGVGPAVPETIYTLLHALRTYRNQLHSYKPGSTQPKDVVLQEDDRRIGLHQFLRVLEWYYVEYPKGEKLASIRTALPAIDERSGAWITYTNWLDEQLDTLLFGEPFGLRQIYVPLRGYCDKRHQGGVEEDPAGPSGHDLRKTVRLVRRLDLLVDAWLAQSSVEQPIFILEGGPGSGKSSFAKFYAAKVAREGLWRVLFVPLHDQLFDLKDNLREGIRTFCRLLPVRPPDDPLDLVAGERLLLVLDGLDEYAKAGRLGAEVVREFFEHVQRSATQLNHNRKEARLLVLLSGRPVAVEAVRTRAARTEVQLVNVLPYFVNLAQRWEAEWDDPDRVLEHDQRHDWWRKYGALTGENLAGMPEEVADDKLDEITTLPFSNQLVAIVRRDAPERLSRGQADLNYFYDAVLEAVHRRAWEPRNRSHPAARGLGFAEFAEALEEIALTAWHSSDGRTTTERAILKRLEENAGQRFREWLRHVQDEAAVHLLLAFFFRPHGRDEVNERTFVFTHKSFGEYLTARRIMREVGEIATDLTDKRPRRGGTEDRALQCWAEVCGPARLTTYILRFMRLTVRAKPADLAAAWQDGLAGLISYMLRHGMPMEKLRLPSFKEMARQALNAEEALMAALSCCTRRTEKRCGIDWPRTGEGTTPAEWLHRLGGFHRLTGFNPLKCLAWVDWSDANLGPLWLPEADLTKCDLRGVILASGRPGELEGTMPARIGADLRWATLTEAILTEADLEGVCLRGANLNGAKLSRALLSYGDPRMAKFQGADLSAAELSMTDLRRADLSGADLSQADLSGADLSGAGLPGANLNHADLSGVDLSHADLRGADLRGANLRGARLTGTNLIGTNLTGANLEGVDLDGADVSKTTTKQ